MSTDPEIPATVESEIHARIRAAVGPAGMVNNSETRLRIRENLEALMQSLPPITAPEAEFTCTSTPEQLAAGEMVFSFKLDRETYQSMNDAAVRAGLTMYLRGKENSDEPPELVFASRRTYYADKTT